MLKICQSALIVLAMSASAHAMGATVVLDTGHSPASPGARSASGYTEYAFNKQATDFIAGELVARGVKVIRTGHDGANWALARRAKAADSADLFLSVHHDSIQQAWIDQGRAGEFSGFAVLASMKNAQSQKSVGCASTIGAAMRSVGEKPSLYHATPIKGENRPLIDAANGVHRFDDLVVLKASKVQAVLLEVGVIVNPHEEYRLADTRFVARYAAVVAEAVLTCIRPGL